MKNAMKKLFIISICFFSISLNVFAEDNGLTLVPKWNSDMWMLNVIETKITIASNPESCSLDLSYPFIQYKDAKAVSTDSEMNDKTAEEIRNKVNRLIHKKLMTKVEDLDIFSDPGACTENPLFGDGSRYSSLVASNSLFDKDIYSLRFASEIYAGGAHGYLGTTYLMIDLKTGNELQLKDFVEEAAFPLLKARLVEKVRQDLDPDNEGGMADDLASGLNKLDDMTGYAMAEGLDLEFTTDSPGGCPGCGSTSVVVSWEELKSFLKEPGLRFLAK